MPEWDDRISDLPKTIQANVFKALQEGMELVAGVSQTNYLTGPRPTKLGVVSGLLRQSVKAGAYLGGEGGAFATGTLTAGQSGVIKYAMIHEYGGDINLPHGAQARARHKMRFFYKGIWMYRKWVRPHKIPIPARPYLKPAMEEMVMPGGPIEKMIQRAIDRTTYF